MSAETQHTEAPVVGRGAAPAERAGHVRRAERAPHFDVAVVGAGPAGLAAAAAASDRGVRVAVIDAAEQPGGQYWRHRSEAFGAPEGGEFHHGWKQYLGLRARFDAGVAAGRITFFSATSVWMARTLAPAGVFALELAPSHGGGQSAVPSIRATSLVLATGGYDRQLPVPGWQLPGVMTAGGIQAFVKQNGMLPGSRFVIAGTGPFLLPVAANITQAGGSVAAVLESASLMGWLPRAHRAAGVPAKGVEGAGYVATFLRHRIPYRIRTVITEILGTDRVTGVRTARVRATGETIPGSEREITGVDGVGLGWGFTPQLELPVQLGVSTRVDVDGSLVGIVDENGLSSVAGLYLAGEITGVGGAPLSVLEGEIAGRSAAASALGSQSSITGAERRALARNRGFAEAMHLAHPVPAGWADRLTPETTVCRCEEVSYGELGQAHDELAADDLRTEKGLTRAGMGWCQGRVCGFAVSCLSAGAGGVGGEAIPAVEAAAQSLGQSAKRPVAQPLPLSALRDLQD
ncbi:NAD(P)/FAD-dependent oxidoreductase [Leucobacter aridicollis]|uniref:Thioredoxin reductase n=1 Tax=Leucobacter aridicollis TaxID=283878 RepID=A0A852RCQ3_9MICO|nr:NAD(P)/FAD-dependent oxidoreductase [Leucobacter aridicollis]MBL3680816.1 FAD-binding protein [Leucobacter aridicollis]NYD28179.1 thioredoxin reductase [Leucobacter aridicollis]